MDVLQHGCCCLSAYSYLSATLCSDKKWKMCFFTCDYIDSYDGTSKKNCNKLSAIFFHLAKLLSKYISDDTTSRYIGEIKTRSADSNFMEVGSLANILAKFTKRKIQIRNIVGFVLFKLGSIAYYMIIKTDHRGVKNLALDLYLYIDRCVF